MTIKFEAIIKKIPDKDATYIEIPFNVEEVFGAKRVKVKAKFDNIGYRGSIVKMGGPCHMIGITKDIRKKIGKDEGDIIFVEVEKDEEERVVEIPDDFAKAMEELKEEGGIPARNKRYTENNHRLIERLGKLGIKPYIDSVHQGPIITTFFYPEPCHFQFADMYEYIKERGYAIYPGKVTEAETFRIGNIGEIYQDDIEKVCDIIEEFLKKYNEIQ